MTDILRDMQPLFDFLNRPKVWPSFMLKHSLQLPHKRTCFLKEGDKVSLLKGQLVDCVDGIPTHEILMAYGDSAYDIKIRLRNLETDNEITIQYT